MKKNLPEKTVLSILFCIMMPVLSSCVLFSSREISVSDLSAEDSVRYFSQGLYGRNGMSFESENFLRGNLLESDFSKDPRKTLAALREYYRISSNIKYLIISADLCRWLALRTSDPEKAVRYHLSVLGFCEQSLSARVGKISGKKEWTEAFSQYFTLQPIYNQACCGVFSYLREHGLLKNHSITLYDAEDKKYVIGKPVYNLSISPECVKDYSLCSSYSVKAFYQVNCKAGIGVPLVAKISSDKKVSKFLRIPENLTLPVTLVVQLHQREDHSCGLTMIYQDMTLGENFTGARGKAFEFPCSLDFTTPLACFLDALPEKNLLFSMLHPDVEEKDAGLYMIDTLQRDKIPVVFVHGLMSSPGTWMQMINSLKNDAEIRRRYQFWFFRYSSGEPVIVPAEKLHAALLGLEKEFCTTPEAKKNFHKMVIVGHSMGGLVTHLLLQDDRYAIMERLTKKKWADIKKNYSPEQIGFVEKYSLSPLPFVHRTVFLSVPHRGASMATRPIARLGSMLTRLPRSMGNYSASLFSLLERSRKDEILEKMKRSYFTGIENLDPDSEFIRILAAVPLKKDLKYHTISGNLEQAGVPGGTDGIVPYSSSHLDGAESELVVKSGHSVQRTPAAIREILRILLLNLKETSSPVMPQ